jgi:4-cresol dehydrogenase (hydroxylating)
MACHNEIMALLNAQGYTPYRLGIQSMNMINSKDKSVLALTSIIKNALDPANVLAPGHYIPSE